jgi:hypothetical protein
MCLIKRDYLSEDHSGARQNFADYSDIVASGEKKKQRGRHSAYDTAGLGSRERRPIRQQNLDQTKAKDQYSDFEDSRQNKDDSDGSEYYSDIRDDSAIRNRRPRGHYYSDQAVTGRLNKGNFERGQFNTEEFVKGRTENGWQQAGLAGSLGRQAGQAGLAGSVSEKLTNLRPQYYSRGNGKRLAEQRRQPKMGTRRGKASAPPGIHCCTL